MSYYDHEIDQERIEAQDRYNRGQDVLPACPICKQCAPRQQLNLWYDKCSVCNHLFEKPHEHNDDIF